MKAKAQRLVILRWAFTFAIDVEVGGVLLDHFLYFAVAGGGS